MPLSIAIIGAGPAGCMLARLLQHHSSPTSPITVTIFESEPHLNTRSQGGTLDLHEHTGLAAIQRAGLWTAFQEHARYDGEAMQITDKNLLCYIRQSGASAPKKPSSPSPSPSGRPEIDRPALRHLLFTSLQPNTIRWNHKVVSVSASTRTITFSPPHPPASGFDLIVGADGAWSHTRAAVSDAQPLYSGVSGYSFSLPSAATTAPKLHARLNGGSLFAFSDGKSIMPQMMGDGSINTNVWSVREEMKPARVIEGEGEVGEVRRRLREEEFADWDERLVEYTQRGEERVVGRNLYMLPVGHRWEHREGVTLVGDAAHVMTPFAGEGVNLALRDSMELAEGILGAAKEGEGKERGGEGREGKGLDERVREFEEDMFRRATATQQLTVDMMNAMFFTPGAPRRGIERYVLRAGGA